MRLSNIGNDILLVETEVEEEYEVVDPDTGKTSMKSRKVWREAARGSVSATTNHFDEDAYYPPGTVVKEGSDLPGGGVALEDTDIGGHRNPKVKPRKMTQKEIGDYARSLVEEANPKRKTIKFK